MIVGIVGGIGAGKSTVRRLCEELGAEAVDADALAHAALETPVVRKALESWLGARAVGPDGKVDRKAVASLVFSDTARLKELEALVHPLVLKSIEEVLAKHTETETTEARALGRQMLVLDVPLLLESPLRERCDAILYVDAPLEVRRRRAQERGWNAQEIERRERLQTPDGEKRRLATVVLDNSNSLDETRRQVGELYKSWMK